jgi:hypothetical protein
MFRGSVKSTGYQLHSPVSPSLPLPCVTMCHHISNGLYRNSLQLYWRRIFVVFIRHSWKTPSQYLSKFRHLPTTSLHHPATEPAQLGVVTRLRDGQPANRGSIFLAARDFPFHQRDHSRPASPTAFYLMSTEGPFPGVNPPKRKADWSPASTNERVNAWSCTSTAPMRLHGVMFKLLKTKRRLFYLKIQFVTRCKHFSSRL